MKEYFVKTVEFLNSILHSNELMTAYYEGESSDFCRMNHNLVRQVGNVEQHVLHFQLIQDKKQHIHTHLTLTNEWQLDQAMLKTTVAQLRQKLKNMPADPFLNLKEGIDSTEEHRASQTVPTTEIVENIRDLAHGLDLVGILATGKVFRGFGNTNGQINWFESSAVNFDWSVYDREDKAIKESYAASYWDLERFKKTVELVRQKLPLMKRPAKRLQPGNYRVYLAPSAVDEIWDLISWEGFSLNALQTKNSCLQQLYDGKQQLHESIQIQEDMSVGLYPIFNQDGFIRPNSLALIRAGKFQQGLIAPRSAKEFSCDSNGADAGEMPVSLAQLGGKLRKDEVLPTLDRGLYISNLWYLNFSDHSHCRMTGMTRFASFWVEDGELIEPVEVMRFDESLYRMFGSQLSALTEETSLLASASTYHKRSISSRRLPGAIVDDFRFTL
ncbi:MAG: metallopeptidase TldD-related protein [Oligoflexus sp.]